MSEEEGVTVEVPLDEKEAYERLDDRTQRRMKRSEWEEMPSDHPVQQALTKHLLGMELIELTDATAEVRFRESDFARVPIWKNAFEKLRGQPTFETESLGFCVSEKGVTPEEIGIILKDIEGNIVTKATEWAARRKFNDAFTFYVSVWHAPLSFPDRVLVLYAHRAE